MTSDLCNLKQSIVLNVYFEIRAMQFDAVGFAGSKYPKSGSSMLATNNSDHS